MEVRRKSEVVVTKSPGKYRIDKYNGRGEIVETVWGESKFKAQREAERLGDKIIYVNE